MRFGNRLRTLQAATAPEKVEFLYSVKWVLFCGRNRSTMLLFGWRNCGTSSLTYSFHLCYAYPPVRSANL